ILIETAKSLKPSRYKVFKLQFDRGEYDMVVYDKQEHCCDVYEIKHSDKMVYDQTKHLIDDDKIDLTESRFGEVRGRYVLYRGEMKENEMGILYRNASEYLKGLPNTAMTEDIRQDIDEEDGGWNHKM
ncbi:MAG: ATP-binding protein, partial [Clostridia bacterium]|nr:ATP-binding protein [Clostridia bacterium]